MLFNIIIALVVGMDSLWTMEEVIFQLDNVVR